MQGETLATGRCRCGSSGSNIPALTK